MKKKYKVSLITILAALVSAILIAVYMLLSSPATAFAASGRPVPMDGTNVFYTSIRGAEVTSGKETKKNESGEDEDHYYTTFKIGEDETVAYRKSLAYKWITGVKDEKGNLAGGYEVKRFSMVIGFDSLDFKQYIISFQSQQYMNSKDKITENFLVFAPAGDGKVGIAAVQTLEDEIESYPVTCTAADKARITISFDSFDKGTVTLKVGNTSATGNELTVTGDEGDLKFKNVYEPYASYISSGDTAVTPLTFSAKFDKDATPAEGEELTADMKLYELNGQSFELYDYHKDGVYDDVIDNAPPVICFTKTPSYVEFGKTISFDYQVIDVLASYPKATACFYVLNATQYEADDFNYSQIKYDDSSSSSADDGEGEKTNYTYPFTKVTSNSDIRVIRDENTFVPARYLEDGDEYSEDYTVYGLIKIYYEISDVTGSSAQTDNVFVDWYVEDAGCGALVDINELKGNAGEDKEYFLKIIDGKDGVTYADSENATYEEYLDTIRRITTTYQGEIDNAISELEDGKLYAGSDSNFYLPDLKGLFVSDEYCALGDYKYSLYYKAKTTGSSNSLNFNKLAIPLNEADVTYRFTIYITDSFGNPMRYPKEENGEIVWTEIPTDKVWDEDYADLLPFFEFDVSYKEATSKNPEKYSTAYVGTSYSGITFDIKGVSGTYTAKYNLYIFDRNAAYNESNINLTYAEFVERFDELFNDAATRKYFTTVKPSSELKTTDDNYELFNAIKWNDTSVSFTPQSAEDFYIVRLTLTDNRTQQSTPYFVTVAASIQAKSLKGESDWVNNNITAIVLFAVAGVLLIACVVLIIVKPKDKGDIDEVYENDKKVKKSKKK